jgi:hypothetical protein
MDRKILGRSPEVLHVRGEVAVSELASRSTKAGEVEAQNRNAPQGELGRDPPRSEEVFRAGEAMGKDCVGSDGALRKLKPGGQGIAIAARKGDMLNMSHPAASCDSEENMVGRN